MDTKNSNADPKSPQQNEKAVDKKEPTGKKSYTTPTLTIYGNLPTLTKTIGMGSLNDGLGGKTH